MTDQTMFEVQCLDCKTIYQWSLIVIEATCSDGGMGCPNCGAGGKKNFKIIKMVE